MLEPVDKLKRCGVLGRSAMLTGGPIHSEKGLMQSLEPSMFEQISFGKEGIGHGDCNLPIRFNEKF